MNGFGTGYGGGWHHGGYGWHHDGFGLWWHPEYGYTQLAAPPPPVTGYAYGMGQAPPPPDGFHGHGHGHEGRPGQPGTGNVKKALDQLRHAIDAASHGGSLANLQAAFDNLRNNMKSTWPSGGPNGAVG